ncbi:MAG: recombinase family protein [Oscillospiraceae bacterium]|jgi:DNA invertase Pin-like site-specific DNA recombinase|nr:recombinase family protein [Oscillospiraceae bacterium]
MNNKQTILYSRLSRDDEQDGQSGSILNQKAFLENHAKKNGFTNCRHIVDDGYSGSTFTTRPGWNELIAEVESGNVGIICSKDMSRIGRDYIRMGLYREMFREKGVRLITVADGFDSDKGEDDLLPFRDIFAEWHARDTSRKIKAIFKNRTAEGKHVTGSILYGYIHDPTDRQKWLIDEEAAEVVRKIFRLVIEGNGIQKIARILEAEKILTPHSHWKALGIMTASGQPVTANPYLWRSRSISLIVEREEYTGKKILRKGMKASYKDKKRTLAPKEDWLVFDGAIPAIIDQETYDTAQRLKKTPRRYAKSGEPPNRLTGLLFCNVCGLKMRNNRALDSRTNRHANNYVCAGYKARTRDCTMHYIRSDVVEELILDSIKNISKYVRNSRERFIAEVRAMSESQVALEIEQNKKLLAKLTRRQSELDNLIKKLYESFAADKIPEKHFEKLLTEYDKEQTSIEPKIAELQNQVDTFKADSVRADKFVELVDKYTDFSELTTPMLNEFVEKVIVHERESERYYNKDRRQKVEIHLNYIGEFAIPQCCEVSA